MPFTSSVFTLPSSPSRAMTSPASATCPRRRPSSRVSSTDAVSTKVFIPGAFEPFHARPVPQPNAGPRVDLAHNGQGEVDALEDAPRRGDACGWCSAYQLEVLRVLDGERPILSMQAARKWEALDVDRRPEARSLDQSLDLAMQPVADVAADPDTRLDQHATGDDARRRIELGGDPFTLACADGPAPRFEESQPRRGAAQRAGHGDQPARPRPLPPEQ